MSVHPIIQHDGTEIAAFITAVKEGISDADAGRTIPYAAVREWLLSWGTEHEKSAPNLIS
ncbi:hypothetical protein Gbfr_008_007 [Gluconobacter frateurii M-2]|nr:hypothetical protein Gbfr_008_007 [Gluconobacter frateurii M-2]